LREAQVADIKEQGMKAVAGGGGMGSGMYKNLLRAPKTISASLVAA
jgi:hypothetical protein